jgi:glycosyltransferase involved in cell wall biosynthesis
VTAAPRVAFIAGSLGQGGAEKQLVYMARALVADGVDVRVYTLSQGEHYEATLQDCGIPPTFVGQQGHPAARTWALIRHLRAFRPDVVHASHFFANLYAVVAAPACRAAGIGSLRNDVVHEVEANGRWGSWLLRLPGGLIANSHAAKRNAVAMKVPAPRVEVVPNVIELSPRGSEPAARSAGPANGLVVLALARLVRPKRLDYFLAAVARARTEEPAIRAVVAGEGIELDALRRAAAALGLLPEGVTFVGRQADVSAVLAAADVLLLTSDHEGFPNAILEAMAAGLPVVTTPAGDASVVVEHGRTGFVTPHGAIDAMAARLIELARSPDLRRQLGNAGRERVAREYAPEGLSRRLLTAYGALARRQGRAGVARRLERILLG